MLILLSNINIINIIINFYWYYYLLLLKFFNIIEYYIIEHSEILLSLIEYYSRLYFWLLIKGCSCYWRIYYWIVLKVIQRIEGYWRLLNINEVFEKFIEGYNIDQLTLALVNVFKLVHFDEGRYWEAVDMYVKSF